MCCEPGISRWALDEEALQLVGMPAAAVSVARVAVDLQTDFIDDEVVIVWERLAI